MKAIVRTGVRDPTVADHQALTEMFLPRGDSTIIDRIFASLEDDDQISKGFVSTNERVAQTIQDDLQATEFENRRSRRAPLWRKISLLDPLR